MPVDPPRTRSKRTTLTDTILEARAALLSFKDLLHKDNEAAQQALAQLNHEIAAAQKLHDSHPINDEEFDSAKALAALQRLATDAAATLSTALADNTDAAAKDAKNAAATAALPKDSSSTSSTSTSALPELAPSTTQPSADEIPSKFTAADNLIQQQAAEIETLRAAKEEHEAILRTMPEFFPQPAAPSSDSEPVSHATLSARLASQEALLHTLVAAISNLELSAASHAHTHDFDAPGRTGAVRAAHTYGDPFTSTERPPRSPLPASSPLDAGYSSLPTNLRMQHSGAALPAQTSTTAKEMELLCAFANGGNTPSKLNGSSAGTRFFTKKQYISLIANGASIARKASWDPASFSEVPGDTREVRIQFSKQALLQAHAFQFGNNNDGSGIGLENIIPLRAGQPAHDLSSADVDDMETLRVTGVTPDANHFLFTAASPTASGPLPSLSISNGADLKARLLSLCRFLKYLFDDSAAPSPLTANPGEHVPACTLTQGLLALYNALESLTAEQGEIGPGHGLSSLVTLINRAIASYSAGLRKLACRTATYFSSPSLSDRLGYRRELADYLQAAFNPVIEQIYGVHHSTLRSQLLAGGPNPPAPGSSPAKTPGGHSTRAILNRVPRTDDNRFPCVAGMVFNACKHPSCKYEHNASKMPASSLGIMLHNCGSLLQDRPGPAPGEAQEGSRA
jgi:hypothetical protein